MDHFLETQDAILTHASYHARLLDTIADLENVPAEVRHQRVHVESLQRQCSESEQKVARLSELTKKERREFETLRDSRGIKVVKFFGKKAQYEEREKKEEREYIEALQQEMTERDHLGVLQRLLGAAKAKAEELEDKSDKLNSANSDLASLYDRIFGGPTTDFPDDDVFEYAVEETTKLHDGMLLLVEAENMAAGLLSQAIRALDECQTIVEGAQLSKSVDMMPGKGPSNNPTEKNVLRRAEAKTNEADSFAKQAMNVSSNVRPVRKASIVTGTIVGDVLLNRTYWKFVFSENIRKSLAQIDFVGRELNAEYKLAQRRAEAAETALAEVANELSERRATLKSFRRQAFEAILTNHPPPPEYEAFIDRMERHDTL